eukprot:ANDGO_04165.mRNA.1 putative oxidoreductase YvrD
MSNLHAVVTGSTAGIGYSIAKALIEKGHRVGIHGRSADRVDAARRKLGHLEQTYAVVGDISTAEGVASVLSQVDKHGDVDVLINNMGIFETKDFADITDEDWLHFFNTNVMSGVRLSRACLPKMLARNFGRIIFVSSEVALRPKERMIHYSVTKAAQVSLARGLAETTKGTKVTVNSLLPGPTWTEGVQEYLEGIARQTSRTVQEVTEEYFTVEERTSLVQRFIEPEEIASAAVFLVENAAVNGSALKVEGGIIRSI